MKYRDCTIEENTDKHYSKALGYRWYDNNIPDKKYTELNQSTAKLRVDEYRNSSIYIGSGLASLVGFVLLLLLL